MGLRGRLRRIERTTRDELTSFELQGGGRYYFNPASATLYLHWYDCIAAGNPESWPEPPEVVRKLTEAKDPKAAIAEVLGGGNDYLVYDPTVLINERRLVPRSLIADRDAYDQDVEDLSE